MAKPYLSALSQCNRRCKGKPEHSYLPLQGLIPHVFVSVKTGCKKDAVLVSELYTRV